MQTKHTSQKQSGVGGVVLGGTAIFSALNGYTPHMAGAIDIMVVEQPDGSLKCSPFYGACCRRRHGVGGGGRGVGAEAGETELLLCNLCDHEHPPPTITNATK